MKTITKSFLSFIMSKNYRTHRKNLSTVPSSWMFLLPGKNPRDNHEGVREISTFKR